jgi:hypothetical protein
MKLQTFQLQVNYTDEQFLQLLWLVKYTGGTSNMLNHLKLKHSSDISGWFTPEKQPSVAEFAYSPRSRKLSSSQNEQITRAIVEMVVLDYMPLKLVEDKWLLNLMSILAPDYN